MVVGINLKLMEMDTRPVFLENVENISVSGLEFTNQASHKLSNGDTKLMHNSDRSGEDERFGILVGDMEMEEIFLIFL